MLNIMKEHITTDNLIKKSGHNDENGGSDKGLNLTSTMTQLDCV